MKDFSALFSITTTCERLITLNLNLLQLLTAYENNEEGMSKLNIEA